jgi:hypothetical protein
MEEKKSTYTAAAKAFYERNKEKILAKEKEGKRWIEYYQKNKEKIAERRKERRKLKPVRPIDEDKIKRYDEIMAELQELKKEVALKKRREKKLPEAAPAPAETPGSA